jgi:leucyl/phenylalanyl-tRNA--protein transferase
MIPVISPNDPPEAFPPLRTALRDPNGLLSVGGDLSPARLLAAYERGIFPWYSAGQPILWWSPDPRMVLIPEEFKVSRSLGKSIRNRGYRTSFDRAFGAVMQRCGDGALRPEGTWISPDMVAAYTTLHELGYAHSVETWCNGELVGGLYGVALGRMFFGESMFSTQTDASKVALHALVARLLEHGYGLIDCQMATAHLASLGGRTLPRRDFAAQLKRLIKNPTATGFWTEPE